jgi:hypothetical protein
VKKHFLYILVLAIFLSSAGYSLAADNYPESNTDEEMELYGKLTEYVTNLLIHPSGTVFYEDATYKRFMITLKFHATSSLEVTRVLKLASESFAALYKNETDSKIQTKVLLEWEKLAVAATTYLFKHPNRLVRDYFIKISQYINEEDYKNILKSDSTRSSYVPQKDKQIENFNFKIEAFANRVKKGLQTHVEKQKFRGTEVEISFDEIKVANRSGNVSYISPKGSRPVVYTIKILDPSVDANEAVYWATKTLLGHEFVAGVYFDDRLKIPSKLPPHSYEVSAWGKNVLIKRPSCSKLFEYVL